MYNHCSIFSSFLLTLHQCISIAKTEKRVTDERNVQENWERRQLEWCIRKQQSVGTRERMLLNLRNFEMKNNDEMNDRRWKYTFTSEWLQAPKKETQHAHRSLKRESCNFVRSFHWNHKRQWNRFDRIRLKPNSNDALHHLTISNEPAKSNWMHAVR